MHEALAMHCKLQTPIPQPTLFNSAEPSIVSSSSDEEQSASYQVDFWVAVVLECDVWSWIASHTFTHQHPHIIKPLGIAPFRNQSFFNCDKKRSSYPRRCLDDKNTALIYGIIKRLQEAGHAAPKLYAQSGVQGTGSSSHTSNPPPRSPTHNTNNVDQCELQVFVRPDPHPVIIDYELVRKHPQPSCNTAQPSEW
ncbi:hypothetical protein GWK47_034909 [Chionoecetes opilio]|uniref:Uncharacterized protein n=1 Tax=Chionoecetes opilio TaxID=41210 RepID=A0A8J5D0I8_CHIOP|nr:hypothetical protein GWK47_034909 [Chionoecetes opilio]